MFLQRSQHYGLLEASRRPLPRKSWQHSNVLVYLILFFGVVNVVEALLIWLGSAWSKQAIDSSVLGPVYRESINTVRRPLYPERLYDASLTARAVDEIADRYATDQKIIALPRGEKLLRSIPFPWDSTMDAFALAGYHSLHSIQLLYHVMLIYAGDNRTISDASLHFLIVLWEDTLCNADLTPLSFAGDVVSNETAIKAAGQMRVRSTLSFVSKSSLLIQRHVCRDWTRVERIATENNACFRGSTAYQGHIDEWSDKDDWLYCPQGSPYQGRVNEYIAYGK
ncbi:hypothetical protein BDV96DRAFT_651764 [Lophiotrema nucula]|uniref:Uncharacterized protein n=1 Tax=Lophiotrema nucula TaxID=690887 RepID=A0A6A5YUP5_9PLEO|nr:hypothetical protein BDV96DRAFT_651764 [Lophiotrema nucula]